tara:strand:- start:69 stop:245 length:177 start_codon:yes stop_codon:yes gene_type:complete
MERASTIQKMEMQIKMMGGKMHAWKNLFLLKWIPQRIGASMSTFKIIAITTITILEDI